MNFFLDIAILVLLEFIEANTPKANTLKELIEWLSALMRHNIFQFILLHSSLLYLLYFTFSNTINSFFVTSAILMKSIDLGFKLYLISKVDKNGHFSIIEILKVPDMPIGNGLRYSGTIIYPLLVLIGVS